MMDDRRKQVITRILMRIQVAFPTFAARFRDDAGMMALLVNEWGETLNGISEESLMEGFEAMRDSGREFAPSAPEFAKWCGGRPKAWNLTWSGIEAKGLEHGIRPEDFDTPPAFRAAVFAKEGITNQLPPASSTKTGPVSAAKLIENLQIGNGMQP